MESREITDAIIFGGYYLQILGEHTKCLTLNIQYQNSKSFVSVNFLYIKTLFTLTTFLGILIEYLL